MCSFALRIRSTQDDVAASLVRILVFYVCIKGERAFFKHLESVIAQKPHLTMDDERILSRQFIQVTLIFCRTFLGHRKTTTGVICLRAMHRDGALKFDSRSE